MAADLLAGMERAARDQGIGAMAELENERQAALAAQQRAHDLRQGAAAALADAEADAAAAARAHGPGLAKLAAADAERARTAPARAQATLERAFAAATRLGMGAIRRLDADLTRTVEQARLGKIDAVIGQKRKLELEIEDLAAGRYPPELFGRLYASGGVGDDEEFWPFEGEYWADEYEGYR